MAKYCPECGLADFIVVLTKQPEGYHYEKYHCNICQTEWVFEYYNDRK